MSKPKYPYWLVSVDMGYGHMRAAYPLIDHAFGKPLIANNYDSIPTSDRDIWRRSRKLYEAFSRLNQVPVVGEELFDIFDWWQEIAPFYPRRDLSKPNFAVKQVYKLFDGGFMKHFVDYLSQQPHPMISTFFLPALAADYYGYEEDIYCIITDTDFSRSWVALKPQTSKIKYFAPTRRAQERLKLYGVPAENIILTGFPLPKENIGIGHQKIKPALAKRIINLDPAGQYRRLYKSAVCKMVGRGCLNRSTDHPLTLMFAVGGAGAQRKMVADILKSLQPKLQEDVLKLILVAGSRQDVLKYFRQTIERLDLKSEVGNSIEIIFEPDTNDYFRVFNEALLSTDVLWTKPSELSFYAAMGIPIIMAPPIGSQEDFNADWLRNAGAGIPQRDPRYTAEWLDDMLQSGWLARAAINGYANGMKRGTYRIEELVAHKRQVIRPPVEPI